MKTNRKESSMENGSKIGIKDYLDMMFRMHEEKEKEIFEANKTALSLAATVSETRIKWEMRFIGLVLTTIGIIIGIVGDRLLH
jgi:hypothetical protein